MKNNNNNNNNNKQIMMVRIKQKQYGKNPKGEICLSVTRRSKFLYANANSNVPYARTLLLLIKSKVN